MLLYNYNKIVFKMLFSSFCPFCGAKIQISFHIMPFTLDKIVNVFKPLILKKLSSSVVD